MSQLLPASGLAKTTTEATLPDFRLNDGQADRDEILVALTA
jgi:hypothetical protein